MKCSRGLKVRTGKLVTKNRIKMYWPIFEGVWAGFGEKEKGRILFLVTTSTSPSLQACAELHVLSPLRGLISPWYNKSYLVATPGVT